MHLSRLRPRFPVRRLSIVVAIMGFMNEASRWVVAMRTRSAAHRERGFAFVAMSCIRSGNGAVERWRMGELIPY